MPMNTTLLCLLLTVFALAADFDPMSWVPAPGSRANINRNNASSVDI